MIKKTINKVKKEICFLKVRFSTKVKLGKRVSIIGPETFYFGKNIRIGKYYKLHNFCEYEHKKYYPLLEIGDNAYIGDFFTVNSADRVHIGKNALIASNVLIVTLNHGISLENNIPFAKQDLVTGPVSIGDNCWIGERVIILPNVKIGNNCIIGANSVVTKSIPSNSIAVGNPARVIKSWNSKEMKWKNMRRN